MPERGLFGMPKPTPEERAAALANPGPTWREFFLFEFTKIWVLLGFLIVDTIVVASFFHPLDLPAVVIALGACTYLEFIGYQCLWYRPPLDDRYRREPFRRTWRRWVEFGRWTPEADRRRSGEDPYGADPSLGPDPSEFL
ncbi:MAG: hypothetical protein L3K19_07485 [Thermoplasmata archaeon]|nr:hypothetical protein [Thermoplasmata archaeon]